MADLKLNTESLKEYAARIYRARLGLLSIEERMDALYGRCGLTGLKVIIYQGILANERRLLKKSQNYLENTAIEFEKLEGSLSYEEYKRNMTGINGWLNKLMEVLFGGNADITTDTVKSGWDKFLDGELEFTKMFMNPKHGLFIDENNYAGFLVGKVTGGVKPEYGKYENDGLLGDKDHFNVNVKQKEKKYKKNKGEDEDWYNQAATILEVKEEVKAEGSVFAAHMGGEKGHVNVDVLYGEAHMGAGAGLYVYTKDKDGKLVKKLSPSAYAEIGASVAAFKLDAEGRIGSELLGGYGKVDATILSAEAKAKASISKDEVFLGASAEADLVKVTGTAGVTVLGTDVGAKASVKVGVGAHANIGYTDGVFKLDIGAAVGVGFDLGLEVDVGGTVDAVTDFCESTVDDVKEKYNDFKEDVKDFKEAAEEKIDDIKKDASKAVKKAGKKVKKFGKKIKKLFS